MRCLECGVPLAKTHRDHKYAESGLSGITLIGMEVWTCAQCGDEQIAIPAMEDLHAAIARHLIMRPERLAAEEIRFLRKHLGLTGRDLADHLGVTPESVSRWENGKSVIEVPADKLLRFLVSRMAPVESYEKQLPHVAVSKSRRLRLGLTRGSHGWKPLTAA